MDAQVQFGHAGACAHGEKETAVAKNKALKEAGAFVPKSFDELDVVIRFGFCPRFLHFNWITRKFQGSFQRSCEEEGNSID